MLTGTRDLEGRTETTISMGLNGGIKKERKGKENAGVYFAQIFYLRLGCSKYAASSRKTNVGWYNPFLAYFLESRCSSRRGKKENC